MPYTSEVGYARLIRPFPYKRLRGVLHHVEVGADTLHKELFKVLTDSPTTPQEWCQALQRIDGLLMSLEDDARDARGPIREMFDAADQDFSTAVEAIQAIGRGLREMEATDAA